MAIMAGTGNYRVGNKMRCDQHSLKIDCRCSLLIGKLFRNKHIIMSDVVAGVGSPCFLGKIVGVLEVRENFELKNKILIFYFSD